MVWRERAGVPLRDGRLGGRRWIWGRAKGITSHRGRISGATVAGGRLLAGFTYRRRAGRWCATPVCLTLLVCASDHPGQDAQPLPHRFPLLRNVNRRISNGVGDSSAGPVPVGFVFIVSHHIPPLVAGVNCLPDPGFTVECDERQRQREPLMGWFTCEAGFMREPPFEVVRRHAPVVMS